MLKIKNLISDQYGLLYSTELLISIILLLFIIGMIASISDGMNEKMLSEEEISSLDKIAIETSDYLLNNPGSPQKWEDDGGIDNGIVSSNIIPGLAIMKKEVENGEFLSESTAEERVMPNVISYYKLKKIKNNYDLLVSRNLLNNSFRSSMAIYPLNSKIGPIVMGDDFDGYGTYDNVNDNNIAVVNRTVKCDFYSGLVVYSFNDLELYGNAYIKEEDCNHDTNPNLENHSNDVRSYWICENFRIYKKSLEDYNYYLISDDGVKNGNFYWILQSIARPNDNKQRLNKEVIDLNPFFEEDMENSSNEIYSIHFNVDKNHMDDFKTLLVAINKNMTNDLIASSELRYDYFKVQDVNFILKIADK